MYKLLSSCKKKSLVATIYHKFSNLEQTLKYTARITLYHHPSPQAIDNQPTVLELNLCPGFGHYHGMYVWLGNGEWKGRPAPLTDYKTHTITKIRTWLISAALLHARCQVKRGLAALPPGEYRRGGGGGGGRWGTSPLSKIPPPPF